jgi:hypothetical protein
MNRLSKLILLAALIIGGSFISSAQAQDMGDAPLLVQELKKQSL